MSRYQGRTELGQFLAALLDRVMDLVEERLASPDDGKRPFYLEAALPWVDQQIEGMLEDVDRDPAAAAGTLRSYIVPVARALGVTAAELEAPAAAELEAPA